MSREAADISRYGGYLKKDRDKDNRDIENQRRHDDEMMVEYPEEEPEEYNPLEEADNWGHKGRDPPLGKWGKKSKGFIKGKTWNGKSKGLPARVKSAPNNKYRGQSPFRKTKKSWGVPWVD